MADDVVQLAKDQLLEAAKESGKIDQKDIYELIADTKENAEILDQFYTELAELNIELVADEVGPMPAAGFDDAWAAEAEEEERQERREEDAENAEETHAARSLLQGLQRLAALTRFLRRCYSKSSGRRVFCH